MRHRNPSPTRLISCGHGESQGLTILWRASGLRAAMQGNGHTLSADDGGERTAICGSNPNAGYAPASGLGGPNRVPQPRRCGEG